jgi:hypothetical protein
MQQNQNNLMIGQNVKSHELKYTYYNSRHQKLPKGLL